ncbi:MAG: hypothetical protein KTR25_04650 [Myxococcales bacterium]|nr:hypothetical protein [Myxococcales bacterium]
MMRLHPTNMIGPYLHQVHDPILVARLVSVTESVGHSLCQLRALPLEQYELDPMLDEGLAVWPCINPYITECLAAAQQTAAETLRCFPREYSTSEDLIDLELDLALDDLDHELPCPILDSHEQRLDEMLEHVIAGKAQTIPPWLAEAANLLEKIVLEHLGRLESLHLREDSFALLSELNELVFRAEKTLDTMVALVIRGLTTTALENVFPNFVSNLKRALRLRAWVADFRIELKHVLSKVQPAHDHYISAIIDHIHQITNTATARPEFQWLRSADRAQIQSFRRWILRPDIYIPEEIERKLSLLIRWSQQMSRINDRSLLVRHDREVVELAISLLNQSIKGAPLIAAIETLYGRSPDLDQLLRQARTGQPPKYDQMDVCLRRIETQLQR